MLSIRSKSARWKKADREGTPGTPPVASVESLETRLLLSDSGLTLPVFFEPNVGQTHADVDYLSRGGAYSLFLSRDAAVLGLHPILPSGEEAGSVEGAAVRMELVHANIDAEPVGVNPLPGISNYLTGSNSSGWLTAIPQYGAVRFNNVYPGIDVVYYGSTERQLEFDFIVAAGADPGAITLDFQGIDQLSIDDGGNLVLQTPIGEMVQRVPSIYQPVGDAIQPVSGGYAIDDLGHVRLAIGDYDLANVLVVDPVLVYSTYLGGSNLENGFNATGGIAVDSSGNTYLAGETWSSNFPTTPGAFQSSATGFDAFVAKLSPDGSTLLYATYLAGTSTDFALDLDVDDSGVAYIFGATGSTNFPVTASAFQTTRLGSNDAFVAKLSPDGATLLYSTYLGGSGIEAIDRLGHIATDGAGKAFVISYTTSTDFPLASAVQSASGGGDDAFVARIDTTASGVASLNYSTYLGGSGTDRGRDIAVDAAGNFYVTGLTGSTNFPTVNPMQSALSGSRDVFLTKFNAAGSMVYSTYLGGTNQDFGFGIAADTSGAAYVTGQTLSSDYPTTAGAFQLPASGQGIFVTKLDAAGSSLVYSARVANSGRGNDIEVDSTGSAYLTGQTFSIPTVDPIQPSHAGSGDAFVMKLSADGSTIDFSTYLGGSSIDEGTTIHVYPIGTIYVTGKTISTNFPTLNALQPTNKGSWDAFAVKIEIAVNSPPIADAGGPYTIGEGDSLSLDASNSTDADSDALSFTWDVNGDGLFDDATGPTPTLDWSQLNALGIHDDGIFNVSVQVDDGNGGEDAATVTLTVLNTPPSAGSDSAVTDEDMSVSINVLANDTDPAGAHDPLTITALTDGAHGTVTIDDKGTADPADDEVVYSPEIGFDGTDSFTYTISDGDGGSASATVTVTVRNLVDFAGRVFDDLDGNGLFEPDAGELGIGGVTVELFDQISDSLISTQTTASDGSYAFDVNLAAGTYKIAAAQAGGYLDGNETAGSLSGTVDNSQDSNEIASIEVGDPGTTPDGVGYLFAEIRPSSLQGLVWEDFDNDGGVDFGEFAIGNVTIALVGTDDRGSAVSQVQATDAQGIFEFVDLRPGTYAIVETQPGQPTHTVDFIDGKDVVGEVNGVLTGDNDGGSPALSATNDQFTGVVLAVPGSIGINYNFGERDDGGELTSGQTASIGFWQNKNGQRLIESLNGTPDSTLLASWLSTTFPNMYGALGDSNGDGTANDPLTNADVAELYTQLFKRNSKTSPAGPPKLDAQVLAVALAVYVTKESYVAVDYTTGTQNVSLVSAVESFGFVVTVGGVGSTFVNVGDSGEAFGVADDTNVQVIDLLLATDDRSLDGLLYDDADSDGDGDGAIDDFEQWLRVLANDVYSAINEA